MTEHHDDSEIGRFERRGQHVYSARDAVGAVALVALLLILFSGGSIRHAAAQIDPGIGQDVVEAVGGPTDWVADRLPLDEAQRELTAGLSPDTELTGGGFDEAAAATPGAARVPRSPPTPSIPPRSAPRRRRRFGSRRSWSPATRSRPRSTPSSPGASRPTGSR